MAKKMKAEPEKAVILKTKKNIKKKLKDIQKYLQEYDKKLDAWRKELEAAIITEPSGEKSAAKRKGLRCG